ncbi:hypothetical protein G3M48_000904 [Beauveria asiatica]|uniref:Uncharacterized protein n=1 Tax=Beauveria asiatica TaxID=1069075 RepID=A0AAW0RFW4_9HYPO
MLQCKGNVVANLPALIRNAELRQAIDRLPMLDTSGLKDEAEWCRAYCLLCFMMQVYVWTGDLPKDRVPLQIAILSWLFRASEHFACRRYVEANIGGEGLCVAYNACLGVLGAFRDKILQLLQDTSSTLRARLKRRFW